MKKAVFLDRDGVLNQTIFRDGKPRAPYIAEDLKLFPGVSEAIKLLKEAGFLTVIVTNQPDVARGWVKEEAVFLINDLIQKELNVHAIKICFHTDKDNCHCRKPRPGMLTDAAQEFSIDLSRSFMVGDRYSDIGAGVAAGCASILVGEGDAQGEFPSPVFKATSLLDATQWILKQKT